MGEIQKKGSPPPPYNLELFEEYLALFRIKFRLFWNWEHIDGGRPPQTDIWKGISREGVINIWSQPTWILQRTQIGSWPKKLTKELKGEDDLKNGDDFFLSALDFSNLFLLYSHVISYFKVCPLRYGRGGISAPHKQIRLMCLI